MFDDGVWKPAFQNSSQNAERPLFKPVTEPSDCADDGFLVEADIRSEERLAEEAKTIRL